MRGIYIIGNRKLRWFKIGMSSNLERRITRLRLLMPFSIEKIGMWAHPNPRWIELKLHKYFAEKRLHGEWFKLTIKDLKACRLLIEPPLPKEVPIEIKPPRPAGKRVWISKRIHLNGKWVSRRAVVSPSGKVTDDIIHEGRQITAPGVFTIYWDKDGRRNYKSAGLTPAECEEAVRQQKANW
jgi:hypothetical protein